MQDTAQTLILGTALFPMNCDSHQKEGKITHLCKQQANKSPLMLRVFFHDSPGLHLLVLKGIWDCIEVALSLGWVL